MPSDEERRIRAVLGVSDQDAVPGVNPATLARYREYLVTQLAFPFAALYAETTPPVRQLIRHVTVFGISEAAAYWQDGLLCQVGSHVVTGTIPLAELGVREDDPNHELIDDYAYWFWNWR